MKYPDRTSNEMMKKVLENLSTDTLIPLPRLAEKMDMQESNVRKALHHMEELGLVKKEPLPPPTKAERAKLHHKPCIFGWKKRVFL